MNGRCDDAARALQFVRSKAAEWNIDKPRIAASGGSAGACSAVAGLSRRPGRPKQQRPDRPRIHPALVRGRSVPQTTLDPRQMKEWTPNSNYGGHAFGFNARPPAKNQSVR